MVGSEMLNPAIRRSTDLLSLIDAHLIVSIPHIQTHYEVRRKKNRRLYLVGALAVVIVAALIAIFFILPPLDTLFDKVMTMLLR